MPRPDLLGHAGPAHDVPPLEHADAQAGAREVAGGGKSVVSGSDDDRVVAGSAVQAHVATATRSLASSSTPPEDLHDLVELLLPRDERRRDLHDRLATVVRPAEQAALEQPRREKAAQQPVALVLGEGRASVLVLHQLEGIEEPGPPNVAHDR